ncbi:relaxase/mobilization nuclease domain-containing protein [Candidatus Thiodiazotropha sp. CDECU1]|uniref:relaxase/mobilization nuclease domain-containing protein n=1 Tax=Candidatus Thiodiazotropha sp. CDECU1 TaxID=3065865 RepID=UPI00292E2905|nr:relaxase/mobilization nuclease domain-containing protein [Candidatus Thiodiazotropha sp. CDECU1]
MILHGNQRGGAKNLALHLTKDENDHVEIHELRGFVADDLISALREVEVISRGTKRTKQYLYSLSLNPPPDETVPTPVFEKTIERAEQKLGLDGQPRAVVFHTKEGRRHCHVVWSRIDASAMKAIPLPFTKRKLTELSRDLFLEQGWKMPRGLMSPGQRDPGNFTLAQWQQAKRTGKDPKAIKQTFRECWAASDSQSAFARALKERGYVLARGDRRGVVALDHRCEVFSVSKWAGVRAKDVRGRLTDPDNLPNVTEARSEIAREMSAHLENLRHHQKAAIAIRIGQIRDKQQKLAKEHRSERDRLQRRHEVRTRAETKARHARFRKGLRGLFDRFTGRHRQIARQNEQDAHLAHVRDRQEKDDLIFRQVERESAIHRRIGRLRGYDERTKHDLERDISRYEDVRAQNRDTVKFERSGNSQVPSVSHGYHR